MLLEGINSKNIIEFTTENNMLYNCKAKEIKKMRSFVHIGHSLSRTVDLQEQDRQTFAQNTTDIADPVFSEEK